MRLLPRSRFARRRLFLVAVSGITLAFAAGLTLNGLRDSISYFYTPSQLSAHARPGETVELGGLVEIGSVRNNPDGDLLFRMRDHVKAITVRYRGSPPDLFREGQGVVASGAIIASGEFVATRILAKHDERYAPRQLVEALKARGEWHGGDPLRPNDATHSSQNAATAAPLE